MTKSIKSLYSPLSFFFHLSHCDEIIFFHFNLTPHPAKRSITVNFFKFRSSFMCTVAILKLFIFNYIYNISQRTAHTIRYCKNTKNLKITRKNVTFCLCRTPLLPPHYPPKSTQILLYPDATRQSPIPFF